MKWIIVFYQVFVTIPEGEIFFSGLENGKNLIKSENISAGSAGIGIKIIESNLLEYFR